MNDSPFLPIHGKTIQHQRDTCIFIPQTKARSQGKVRTRIPSHHLQDTHYCTSLHEKEEGTHRGNGKQGGTSGRFPIVTNPAIRMVAHRKQVKRSKIHYVTIRMNEFTAGKASDRIYLREASSTGNPTKKP